MKQSKKVLKFVFMLFFLIVITSCSKEEVVIDSTGELPETSETASLVYNYKGIDYPIQVEIDGNGEYIFQELPEELKKLENIETLATVVEGNKLYFFDNEQESLDHFYDEKTAKSSNSDALRSGSSYFDVSAFNRNVRAYAENWSNGKKLTITQGYQLRDLTKVGFNDVMSSIAIDTEYQNVYVGDVVTLYEHKDFEGRSLKFICEFQWSEPFCQFISGASHNMIPGRLYRGYGKFRHIPFKLVRRWADKVSSIDVKFGGSSVVPPYPSGGGGGGGDSSDRPRNMQ